MDDTIIVSVDTETNNVQEILIKRNCWYAVEISKERWKQITHIAVYVSDPVSAIKYIAEVIGIELIESIERLQARVGVIKQETIEALRKEEGKKCVIYFSEKRVETVTTPIKKGKNVKGIQGRRYTNYEQLQHALLQKEPTLDDLFQRKH